LDSGSNSENSMYGYVLIHIFRNNDNEEVEGGVNRKARYIIGNRNKGHN